MSLWRHPINRRRKVSSLSVNVKSVCFSLGFFELRMCGGVIGISKCFHKSNGSSNLYQILHFISM